MKPTIFNRSRPRPLLLRAAWGAYWLWCQVLLCLVFPAYDHIVDSISLRRAGYRKLWFGPYAWHNPQWREQNLPTSLTLFPTRTAALDHMRAAMVKAAVAAAITSRGTNFSGKSRNSACPCGSGRKFKSCCMNRNSPQ